MMENVADDGYQEYIDRHPLLAEMLAYARSDEGRAQLENWSKRPVEKDMTKVSSIWAEPAHADEDISSLVVARASDLLLADRKNLGALSHLIKTTLDLTARQAGTQVEHPNPPPLLRKPTMDELVEARAWELVDEVIAETLRRLRQP